MRLKQKKSKKSKLLNYIVNLIFILWVDNSKGMWYNGMEINKKGVFTTMQQKRITTQAITKIALLAALLSVSAYITIPMSPVPFTMQTLIINMIAILLTPFESFLTVLIYILIGFVGVPVFSGGAGGPAKLFGPTGGYIMAFLISAPIMSLTKVYAKKLTDKFIKNDTVSAVAAYTVNAVIIGMIILYLLGTVYMKAIVDKSWAEVLAMAVIPFIPLDLVKCVIASVISVPVKKALDKIKR